MSPHYFVKHRTITVSLYCSPQKVGGSENSSCYVVWQRTSGKPTSQELFKMTEFCVNERFQSVTPLINRIIHHARSVGIFQPTKRCRNSSAFRIATWYALLQCVPKIWTTKLIAVTLSNRNRFSKLFHY